MRTYPYLRALRLSSVAFLSLPWFVFFATWLRTRWGITFAALLAVTLARYASASGDEPIANRETGELATRDRITKGSLIGIVLLAVAWASFGGAGGMGYQNLPDWNNKNVLMSDLLRYEWPVVYDGSLIVNYYFALYLPASLLGKFAGWDAAQWFVYAQVLTGTVLSLLWVYSFAGRLGLAALVLFVVFGGLDIVGYLIMTHHVPSLGSGIEWWAKEVQFSSNTTQLFWVPQHSLAGWIIGSLMLDEAARLHRVLFAGLFAGLCLLWSPFVAIGLLPVGVAALYIAEHKSIVSVSNLVFLPLVSLLMLAFYWPHKSGGDLDADVNVWRTLYSSTNIMRHGVFVILEVGVYLLPIAVFWKRLSRSWRALAVTVAVSSFFWILVPERVGHGGFTMRSSIPTLFLLCLLLAHVLSFETHRLVRVAVVGLLVLGSASAVQEVARSIERYPTTIPAPRPTTAVLGLRPRQKLEFVMPFSSPLYRAFFRTPS